MTHRRLTAGLALGAALALAAAGATDAQAASRPKISVFASGAHANVNSDYLAGYTTTQVGISRASAIFTVPAMSCGADLQGTAAGIGNEQVSGAPTLLSVVFLACASGSPFYTTQVQAGGNIQQGSAAAGDHLKVAITQTRTAVTSTLTDVTQNTVIKTSGVPTPDNTVTFGSFPLFSGSILPVADFGSLAINQATLENTALPAWSPTKLVRKSGTTTEINVVTFFGPGRFRLNFVSN